MWGPRPTSRSWMCGRVVRPGPGGGPWGQRGLAPLVLIHDGGAEGDAPCHYVVDGGEDRIGVVVLGDVTPGAAGQCAVDQLEAEVAREHDDAGCGAAERDLGDDLEGVLAGHVDIEEDDGVG